MPEIDVVDLVWDDFNGAGIFYPVSARRASTKERNTYRAWKAGKQ